MVDCVCSALDSLPCLSHGCFIDFRGQFIFCAAKFSSIDEMCNSDIGFAFG